MKNLLTLLILSAVAFGQSVSTSPPIVTNQFGQPVANVLVTICNTNPGTGACGSLAPTFTDPTLAHLCTGSGAALNNLTNPSAGGGCSNPGYTDGLGNVVAFGNSGFLWCQYSSPSIQPYSTPCEFPVAGGINTGVFTNTQCNTYMVSQIGPVSPCSFFHSGYNGFGGQGGFSTDAITGIVTAPVGATAHQFNGLNATCITNAVSSPLGALENCVAVFGTSQAAVNSSASWGGNVVSYDTPSTSGSLVIGFETDVGLFGAPNRFTGYFLTGAPLAGTMPAGPVMGTLNIASNSSAAYGVAFANGAAQFPVAFWSARGTAPVGLMLDASCYTGACNSQSIQMGANNGTTALTGTIQVDQIGDIYTTSTGTGVGWGIPTYSFSQLNSSAPNGVMLYCTNCNNVVDDAAVAGHACASTPGHGAFAKRENGRWDCN